jgi:hypothetical protein
MNVNLRFGMHRDIQLIHEERELIDGIVVPANILAHQTASTSVFIASLTDKPYIIDPMTCILQSPVNDCLNDNGEVRPSVAKTLEAYHPHLVEHMLTNNSFVPTKFLEYEALCRNVLSFKKDKVTEGAGASAANKYLKRYRNVTACGPRMLLSPYFCFGNVADIWYKLSLQCAQISSQIEAKVAPVICCSVNALSTEGLRTILDDYRKFDNVFIWIDDYSQASQLAAQIKKVRSLINSLHDAGCSVETLYGGFLMLMSKFDGLLGLSHGILYTQHKSRASTPGGGGAPERYYIPAIHEFRSLSQTDLILHKHPELICDCAVCERHLGGNPDNIIHYRDNPDLLRRHFLSVRRGEANDIETAVQSEIVRELRRVFDEYDASFQELPNPDAFVSEAPMPGLAYLSQWADAFSA